MRQQPRIEFGAPVAASNFTTILSDAKRTETRGPCARTPM
jgi:hypothetical protein